MKKNQLKSKKVAIIGAGIVGLYLAWKLSKKGHKVTVFEKQGKIGKECCSGLFSERILEFIPESKKLIQNKIDFTLIHFPRKTIKVRFKKKFFVISHAELDRLVAEFARKAGAEIILNKRPVESELARFERVIGCDGPLSETRNRLGLKNPSFRLGMLRIMNKKDFSNYVETWAVKGGFRWKIPRGRNTEYGAILPLKLAKNYPAMHYDSFALVPQGLIIPKNKKITLCGDASGLTKPWSGGGVVWGLTAADMILKNFPDMIKYRKDLMKFFIPQIVFSKMAKFFVYFFGFKFPVILPSRINIEGDYFI